MMNKIKPVVKGFRALTPEDKKKYYELMHKVNKFCDNHEIQTNSFTYYRFKIKDKKIVVTNDAFIYKSFKAGVWNKLDEANRIDLVFYASKFRIVEIYKDLMLGKELDERGRVISTPEIVERLKL